MTKAPAPKSITKKYKARLERERIQRRRILFAAFILGALIVGVLLYGVLDQTVLKAQRVVAKVDDQSIRSNEFIKHVKFQRQQLNQQALQYESFKQMFGASSDNSAYIDSLISQIQSQMEDLNSLGSGVLDNMINDIIIAKYAEANGITVTDAEVAEAFQSNFGYYPNGTPTPQPTVEVIPTSTMNPTQYAIVTATPTSEPTATATLEPTAAAEEPTATPEAVESTPAATSTPFPTATPYTQEGYEEQFQAMVDSYAAIDFSEADLLKMMKTQLLGRKVYEAVTAGVETQAEQVWARHILVATLEEAQAVKERLDAGEDFAALAAELSTDESNKAQGGDLGWFGTGVMDPAFEAAAYALNPGEISEPVQSSFGYHLIQLVGKEVRPISSSDLDQQKSLVFQDWLTAEKEKYTIEKFDDVWSAIVPSEPAFMQ